VTKPAAQQFGKVFPIILTGEGPPLINPPFHSIGIDVKSQKYASEFNGASMQLGVALFKLLDALKFHSSSFIRICC
jgi:hypothetical protein